MGTRRTKHPGGRPARTDRPMKMLVVLPLTTRKRLEAQAEREGRPMSDVVADAIDLYARERKGPR